MDEDRALVLFHVMMYYARLYVKQLNWRHRRVKKWGLMSGNLPRKLFQEAIRYGFKRAEEDAHRGNA